MTLRARASVLGLPAADPPRALALDLACGQGRHVPVLRGHGYDVVAMDVAMHALRAVRAQPHGAAAMALQADTDAWPFRRASFDLVVQVDFLDRGLFPHIRESLRDGGLLLIDTFLAQERANAEGPSRPEFLLQPGELPRTFGDFTILAYEETRAESARAMLLARK